MGYVWERESKGTRLDSECHSNTTTTTINTGNTITMLRCIASNSRRCGKTVIPEAMSLGSSQGCDIALDIVPQKCNDSIAESRGISSSVSAWRRLKSPLPPLSERPQVGYRRRNNTDPATGEKDEKESTASHEMDAEGSPRVSGSLSSSSALGSDKGLEQRPDLVERYMSLEMESRKDRTRATLQQVAKEFARFPGDTGSSDVQVALLTSKIAILAEHVKAHPKDHSSRRGLRAMLHGRRQLLQYLRRTQFDRYAMVISRLGLKDSFGPQDRFTQRYS